MYVVSETAQVELKSGRQKAPARWRRDARDHSAAQLRHQGVGEAVPATGEGGAGSHVHDGPGDVVPRVELGRAVQDPVKPMLKEPETNFL